MWAGSWWGVMMRRCWITHPWFFTHVWMMPRWRSCLSHRTSRWPSGWWSSAGHSRTWTGRKSCTSHSVRQMWSNLKKKTIECFYVLKKITVCFYCECTGFLLQLSILSDLQLWWGACTRWCLILKGKWLFALQFLHNSVPLKNIFSKRDIQYLCI